MLPLNLRRPLFPEPLGITILMKHRYAIGISTLAAGKPRCRTPSLIHVLIRKPVVLSFQTLDVSSGPKVDSKESPVGDGDQLVFAICEP